MQQIRDLVGLVSTVLLLGMLLLLCYMIFSMLLDFLSNVFGWHRISPEKQKQAEAAYNERLLNPTPEAVEEFLCGKLPSSVLALYANHELLIKTDLSFTSPNDAPEVYEWNVAFFTPCLVEDQKHSILPKRGELFDDELIDSGFFEFANDGCGNCFYVQMADERVDDAPVYFFNHELGDLYEPVANSVRDFLVALHDMSDQ